MKPIMKCKPTRLEKRFNTAINAQKVLTGEELEKWQEDARKETPKKVWFDTKSIYYGHIANRYKDLKERRNWRKKHPEYMKEEAK